VWENNAHPTNYHGQRYRNLSVQLVENAHPDWPAAKANAEAKATFQQAAVSFIVQTLELCTRMRPRAVWGFYGMESSLEVGSDVMVPIYQKSKALFPDIYVSQAPASAEQRRAVVRSKVAAAVNTSARLAAPGGPRIPVYPFAWECYHNGSTLLSYADLQTEIIEPYNAGASGVVVWGYTAGRPQGGGVYGPVRWRPYLHYVANKTGPLVAQFRQRAADCAHTGCSGHGRCTYVAPLPPTEATAAAAPSCSCDLGWSGVDCSKHAAKTAPTRRKARAKSDDARPAKMDGPAVHIGMRKQLMVDRALLSHCAGASIVLQPLLQMNEPVLRPDAACESDLARPTPTHAP
jgi:hypothetical protein